MTIPVQKVPARFRFTGWHISGILVLFFGVVIAVNIYMAGLASSTFSGVVVENSYVASQNYNKWLDEAAREKALGWSVKGVRLPDGRVSVRIIGSAAVPLPQKAVLSGEAWHPLGTYADRVVTFRQAPDGAWVSFDALPAGRWNLRLRLEGGGHVWRGQEML
jgi:nitrogen fixation protein FixH